MEMSSLKEKILKRLEAMDEEACIWKFINAWLLDPEEEDWSDEFENKNPKEYNQILPKFW